MKELVDGREKMEQMIDMGYGFTIIFITVFCMYFFFMAYKQHGIMGIVIIGLISMLGYISILVSQHLGRFVRRSL